MNRSLLVMFTLLPFSFLSLIRDLLLLDQLLVIFILFPLVLSLALHFKSSQTKTHCRLYEYVR